MEAAGNVVFGPPPAPGQGIMLGADVPPGLTPDEEGWWWDRQQFMEGLWKESAREKVRERRRKASKEGQGYGRRGLRGGAESERRRRGARRRRRGGDVEQGL